MCGCRRLRSSTLSLLQFSCTAIQIALECIDFVFEVHDLIIHCSHRCYVRTIFVNQFSTIFALFESECHEDSQDESEYRFCQGFVDRCEDELENKNHTDTVDEVDAKEFVLFEFGLACITEQIESV